MSKLLTPYLLLRDGLVGVVIGGGEKFFWSGWFMLFIKLF